MRIAGPQAKHTFVTVSGNQAKFATTSCECSVESEWCQHVPYQCELICVLLLFQVAGRYLVLLYYNQGKMQARNDAFKQRAQLEEMKKKHGIE